MLNLNYNINNSLRNQRNFLKGKVDYRWRRTITTAAGLQSGSIIFGTGSIDFVPFDVETYFLSGTYEAGELSSGSAIGQPVTMKVTGSGVWPTTGSNSLYIVIGSSLGFNQTSSLFMSAEAGNMNLSGSIISSSFLPVLNNEYNVDFGVNHTKGNIFNPLVLWKSMQEEDLSGLSVDLPINGYTSSFNIVKNENELLVNIREVSGSISSSFEYLYNFGVTASLTASINNVTGSTTMSILIPEAGVSTVNRYFNPTTTNVAFTASFVATTDSPYTITGSVEYNKGNLSVADINYRALQTSTTQDLEGNGTNLNGPTSSFSLRKDIAQKVLIPQVSGAASVGSYNNENSFNQTASLSQNVNNTTGSVTMSIVVPESGINVTQSWFNPTTTTAALTSSFVAQTITGSYNVTASVINNKGNESNSDINWLISSSVAPTTPFTASASFRIEKDVSYNRVVLAEVPNAGTASISSSFQNQWAFNMTASLSASFVPYYSGSDSSSYTYQVTSLRIPQTNANTWSYDTASLLTASFTAQTDIEAYGITASVLRYTNQLIDFALIGGGGGSSAGNVIGEGRFFRAYPGAGAGAGAVLTGSINILQNYNYQVVVGNGGAVGTRFEGFPATNGETSSLIGQVVPYPNLDPYAAPTLEYITAPGGGAGGNYYNQSQSGGSGAGKAKESIGAPTSASIIELGTMTASLLNPNLTGTAGSSSPLCGNGVFGGSGNGGGKETSISWLTINGGLVGGGGKRGGTAVGSFQECDPGAGNAYGGGGAQGWIPDGSPQGPAIGFVRPPINGTGGGAGGGSLARFNDNNFSSGSQGGSGSFSIRYLGAPKATGGAVTSSGEYTVHTFLRSQDLIWNNQLPTSMSIDYLLVAGGGGTGRNASGGAGGGGIISGSLIAVNRTPLTIVVGAGGASTGTPAATFGAVGNPSQISNLTYFTSSVNNIIGGGNSPGADEGSGPSNDGAYGGGGKYNSFAGGIGVLGFNGGSGSFIAQNNNPPGAPIQIQYLGGGGGAGAGQNGANAYTGSAEAFQYWTAGLTTGSEGGNGLLTNFSGSAYFSGGGGGCRSLNGSQNVAAPGGLGGGGNGGSGTDQFNSNPPTSGEANTGGGGGGAYWGGVSNQQPLGAVGANGGSGIALIKYAGAPVATGGIVQYDGVNTIHRFESSGLFEFIQ